ncbi:MAG: TIGR04141 family sporadically distributed protein [Actinobacteria bacterium]|nr:TIGR04141 family sporadically distributed protein [Actinomycetota bacterium]
MAKQPRLEKLTISLLKADLGRADILHDPGGVAGHRIALLNKDEDSLFTASSPPHPPDWTRFLDPHTTVDLKSALATASASAVLVSEAEGRLFAVTWGQGRHLLESDAFEQDFGLKVVLNTVAPDQLKSVDAKTIDETTVHTRRDVSRDSPLTTFELDPSRDLLRAVTGTPSDQTLAHRLTGADSLGIVTREQVPDLPKLGARLLKAYASETYKENFDFVDYLRPVKSQSVKEELDARLLDVLAGREIDDVHLAAPEVLDWLDVDGFRYRTGGDDAEKTQDPRISVYLDARTEDPTFEDLKRDHLIAVRATDGGPGESWPIYRCIVYQVELDEYLYVLSGGAWFRVDRSYRDKIEREVRELNQYEDLPSADLETSEDAYNQKAAIALGALCLDRKLVYDGGPGKMELCDLLTDEGRFVHFKLRGSSSTSATFSHRARTAPSAFSSMTSFARRPVL